MRKILLLLILTFSHFLIRAQEISYGPVIGGVFYESTNNHGSGTVFDAKGNRFSLNFGAYAEYNFYKKLGLKVDFVLNNRDIVENYYEDVPVFKLSYIELNPSFKYNFGKEYYQGFYMTLGPRFSLLTKAEVEDVDVSEVFEDFHIGIQLGLGHRLFKYLDLQCKLDSSITPYYNFTSSKNSFWLAAYFTINVDLQKLINH